MDGRSRTILRSVLVGYVALIAASILTDSALLSTAADLGFAVVAGFFAYVIYTDRSPSDDVRLVIGSAGALVGAAVTGVIAVVLPGLAAVDTASTILFVAGFFGYLLSRRW